MRDRRERFVALAEARTDRALTAIRLLGNLSNRSNYEFAPAELSQIISALETEVKALKVRYSDATTGRQSTFKLKK